MHPASHIALVLFSLLVGTGVPVSSAQSGQDMPAADSHHDALLTALVGCIDVPVEAWIEAREYGEGAGMAAEVPPKLTLDWGGALPFMEASVSAYLLAGGTALSEGASNGAIGGRLRIDVDEGSLRYVRAPRRAAEPLERRIRVGLRYTMTQPDGTILASDSCVEDRSDLHSRRLANALADPRWSVTNPDIPQTGRWRRTLQPAVLVAATAIGTYLFFNLRSDRADGN